MKPLRAGQYNCYLVLFALLAFGCHETTAPTELTPLPLPASGMPSVQALPPFVGELFAYPGSTLSLPSYGFAERVKAEIRIEGLIEVSSVAHSSFQLNASVGAKGVRSSNGECAVGVSLAWSTTFGPYGSCPPPNTTPYDSSPLWIDTVSVGGVYSSGPSYGQPVPGGATRGPKIVEPSFSPCQDSYEVCHGYSGSQMIRLTPLASQLALFPADTVVYAWQDLSFSARANPSQIGSHVIPVYVLAWKWIPNGGTAVQPPGWSCAAGSSVCQFYIQGTGLMEVTARVNGVLQVDSTKVTVSQAKVRIVPAMSQMKFSIEIPDSLRPTIVPRHDTSRQEITVSVLQGSVPVPNAIINLTLTARDGTGGHLHTGGKPRGSLSLAQVNTGSSGVGKVVFTAPEVTGPVTIKGTAANATADSAIIDIGIALVEFVPGTGYELVGGNTYGGKHPKNHYVTATHLAALQHLIAEFRATFNTVLKFNDSSLELGGLFDFNIPTKAWLPGHQGHREGKHTDLHTKPPAGEAGDTLTDKEKALIRRVWAPNAARGIKIRRHLAPTLHFHLDHS